MRWSVQDSLGMKRVVITTPTARAYPLTSKVIYLARDMGYEVYKEKDPKGMDLFNYPVPTASVYWNYDEPPFLTFNLHRSDKLLAWALTHELGHIIDQHNSGYEGPAYSQLPKDYIEPIAWVEGARLWHNTLGMKVDRELMWATRFCLDSYGLDSAWDFTLPRRWGA